MLAFRVESKERLMFWIKTFAFRYHSQFGDLENFTCKWTNKEKDDNITEIYIQLLKGTNDDTDLESNKLITFHIYPTTYLITIQRIHFFAWANKEFPYLKYVVDYHFKTPANEQNSLLDTSSDYNDFVTLLDHSETKPMKVSTPRIVIPLLEKKKTA